MAIDSPSTSSTTTALTSTSTYRTSRPSIVGPPSPLYLGSPYPIRLRGRVCRGFGRGGKDLGCPTANLPDDEDEDEGNSKDERDGGSKTITNGNRSGGRKKKTGVQAMKGKVDTGVFYGFARVLPSDPSSSPQPKVSNDVHPMVMSLGLNPFYKNERLSAEIHIMHEYEQDFYGMEMKVLVLGYIRPELDYVSREALIEDINTDKSVALNSLARPDYAVFEKDEFFYRDDIYGENDMDELEVQLEQNQEGEGEANGSQGKL
ncbi:riboflavin kinase [Lentinula raphanica]|uniref:Riboflavin kinase n=1 Tax=Lentinula raphanica TaxID=153919 RepID=A0AA38PA62_9AGAR|nr:riboflavin kinase [Lentinula raphanica]KAJ3839149.1 riboflavin kinase [Lentinula raphanica]